MRQAFRNRFCGLMAPTDRLRRDTEIIESHDGYAIRCERCEVSGKVERSTSYRPIPKHYGKRCEIRNSRA